MLPPFIIEQIRRREEEDRRSRRAEQPRLELPIDVYPHRPEADPKPAKDDVERGVVIFEI